MQDTELLAKHPPDDKQQFDQHSKIGQVLDQLLDASLELRLVAGRLPHLFPEAEEVPRRPEVTRWAISDMTGNYGYGALIRSAGRAFAGGI